MDVSFVLGRVDDDGSTNVQLRVTCWGGDKAGGAAAGPASEVWYRFRDVDPAAWTTLAQGARVCGQDARQRTVLQAPRRLRLDFFFDPNTDVLAHPF